jgi:hypothetical protein
MFYYFSIFNAYSTNIAVILSLFIESNYVILCSFMAVFVILE